MASLQRCAILSSKMHQRFGCLTVCREDVSNNLTLAVAPDDFKDESQLDANDFLIRGITGIDPKGGAIAIGDTIGVGKRIRFMVGVVATAICNAHILFCHVSSPNTIAANVIRFCASWCFAGS